MFTREKHREGRGSIEGKQGSILNQSERKPIERKTWSDKCIGLTPKRLKTKLDEKHKRKYNHKKTTADIKKYIVYKDFREV